MRVVATAGHVDHGKSTLVRALTGTEPDRWDEERRRGLTIDLGYAWTTLEDGETVAFVDVPGHQGFIANMLAGLGPAPAVLLVVAADEGWRRQTGEHLAAAEALGLQHGLVAVTRADLADPGPTVTEVRERLRGTGIADAEIVTCSGATGEGLGELRAALARLCAALPQPDLERRARLWVDRVFTVRGAGTVVTGTLESGTLRPGDEVVLRTAAGARAATVRGLHCLEQAVDAAPAVARVAVNLRGTDHGLVERGDALLTGRWRETASTDVRLTTVAPGADPLDAGDLPEHLMAHVGTAALQVRVRPLDGTVARLTWQHALPLTAGDRLVLRDPGRQTVLCGALVLDADPPALTRRGAARARGEELREAPARVDPRRELARRGWLRREDLLALGAVPSEVDQVAEQVPGAADLLVHPDRWLAWTDQLRGAVDRAVAADPLQARLTHGAAVTALDLPDRALLPGLVAAAGLASTGGHVHRPREGADLGAAEAGLRELEQRLEREPFLAPERDELVTLGLGPRQLAAAVRLGRLVDLGDQVVLAPTAPARAMRELAALPQPFTISEARQALGTSRRVMVPLLEHLDGRGWTRRLDTTHREVVRPGRAAPHTPQEQA